MAEGYWPGRRVHYMKNRYQISVLNLGHGPKPGMCLHSVWFEPLVIPVQKRFWKLCVANTARFGPLWALCRSYQNFISSHRYSCWVPDLVSVRSNLSRFCSLIADTIYMHRTASRSWILNGRYICRNFNICVTSTRNNKTLLWLYISSCRSPKLLPNMDQDCSSNCNWT